jgi:hypothetical protein
MICLGLCVVLAQRRGLKPLHSTRQGDAPKHWSSYKERMEDTLAPAADEGRNKLRKARGSRYRLRSLGLRMGQPRQSNVW